jgi:hypothetical protein
MKFATMDPMGRGPLMGVVENVGSWLKNNQHWIGVAGILIGAAISIYTYVATRESGEITLKFNTVKIAEAGIPSIKIFDKQNNPITGNVFGCEIVIWNTGNLSLGEKADRIREPLTIAFTDGVKMIDSTVQDTKNVPSDAIKLDHHENQITVGWSQFDPNDAIKIFVIYASTAQSSITYRGRFLQTKITDVSEFQEEQPVLSGFARFRAALKYDFQNHPNNLMLIIFMIVAFFFCVFMTIFRKLRESKWAVPIGIFVFTIFIINTIVMMLNLLPSSNPFQ